MGSLDLTVANNIIDATLGTAAFVDAVTPIRCRLMTANGSNSVNGTELATGGGYTSGVGAPIATFAAAAALTASNSAAITIANMPTATVVGIELWDSAGTPKRKWWGTITVPRTTNAGDTLTFAIGAITASIP